MFRLKKLREDNDLKQKDIAKLLNITQTNYSKYELNKINIPINVLITLSLFYNVSVDYILGLTDNSKPYIINKETIEYKNNYSKQKNKKY